MTAKKEARRSCSYDTRHNVHSNEDNSIITEYDRTTLIAGIIIAISFGLMMVHWAVAPWM